MITDSCDGQDANDVARALAAAQDAPGPVLIACRTQIGFGLPSAGTQKAHSDAPGAEAIAAARLHANSEAAHVRILLHELFDAIDGRGC